MKLYTLFTLLLVSCVPAQVVNKKLKSEKEVIEVERKPIVIKEEFVYGLPSGRVDIGIIMNNSSNMNELGAKIRDDYWSYTQSFQQNPFLFPKGNIVETPSHLMASHSYSNKTQDIDFHNSEVYSLSNNFLFKRVANGLPRPFESAAQLFEQEFKVTDMGVPLYLFFVLSKDMEYLNSDDKERIKMFEKLQDVISSRNFVKVYLVSNYLNICDGYEYPENFLNTYSRFFASTPIEKFNICTDDFNYFSSDLQQDFLSYKTRMVLFHQLNEAPLITVSVGGEPLEKEAHYKFDQDENEVLIIPYDQQLTDNKKQTPQVGELVNVKYFVEGTVGF
jgi:hypothetical protein